MNFPSGLSFCIFKQDMLVLLCEKEVGHQLAVVSKFYVSVLLCKFAVASGKVERVLSMSCALVTCSPHNRS
jgi:hypothetical protein